MKDNPGILLPALPVPFYGIGTMLEFWALFLPIRSQGLKISRFFKLFTGTNGGQIYGTGKFPIPAKNDLKVCFLFQKGLIASGLSNRPNIVQDARSRDAIIAISQHCQNIW